MSNFSTFKNFQPTVEPTGSIAYNTPFFNKDGYIETGRTYLQSQYPSLFSIVGRVSAYTSSPNNCGAVFGACWSGTSYLVCGYNVIARSTTGLNSSWTNITPNAPQIAGIGAGGGTAIFASPFVNGYCLARSTDDGLTWKGSLLCGGINKVLPFNTKYIFLRDDGDWYNSYGGFWYSCDNATGANGIHSTFGNQFSDGIVQGSTAIVVGTGGKSYTSTDGTTWTSRTTGTTSYIWKITYGNALYVYGTTSGGLGTSTDAITWTARTSGTTSWIYSIAYGNSTYVYVGSGGALATSTDAITWTQRTSGLTGDIRGIIFQSGQFVKYGASGVIRTSTDGITWTARTSNTASYINTLVYENGLYLYGTVGGGIGTSTDAITWTARASNGGGGDIRSILWDGSKYVANGYMISTSTDGTTWTNLYRGPAGTNGFEYVCYSPTLSMFVAIGYNGHILTSTDAGITWTRRTSPSAGRYDFVEWFSGPGLFAACGSGITGIVTSSDGITWTQRTITGYAGTCGQGWWNGTYAVFSTTTNNTLVRSSDGINYSLINLTTVDTSGVSATFPANGVITSNSTNTIYAVSTAFMYVSPNNDLINWTVRPIVSAGTNYWAAYSPTLNRVIYANFSTDNGNNIEYSASYNIATEFMIPNYVMSSGTSQRTWIKT